MFTQNNPRFKNTSITRFLIQLKSKNFERTHLNRPPPEADVVSLDNIQKVIAAEFSKVET